jgi:photosystem I P700 chlorophyll a apoprotein A1
LSDGRKPGHFDRTLSRGPKTTTWIWNLHADAHDFDSHTSDLEDISRKIFSAHFGHLAVIFIWLSGMYFHGAKFSNYEAWLTNPTGIKPSAQVVWPIFGQEILNADVGGGFQGIQITSGLFQMWRANGITNSFQLYCTAIGALGNGGVNAVCWVVPLPQKGSQAGVVPKCGIHDEPPPGRTAGSGLLGLCRSANSRFAADQRLLDAIDAGKPLTIGGRVIDSVAAIPLPHEWILDKSLMADLYPSFAQGLKPFFTLNWSAYTDFLTFKGGLNPVTGGLWLSDTAHHHLALAVLFIVAGHFYRTNWGIGHSFKEVLEAHKGPFTGEGHKGMYEIFTTSWHASCRGTWPGSAPYRSLWLTTCTRCRPIRTSRRTTPRSCRCLPTTCGLAAS